MQTANADQITVPYLENLAAVLAIAAESAARLAAGAADGDYTCEQAAAIVAENFRTLALAAKP